MALLTFPAAPVNGELYPVIPIAGQNQYQWDAANITWRLLGTATGVVPGTYGGAELIPQFTVDPTGRIVSVADVNIGSYYVKTNNPAAFNGYIWPLTDGAPGTYLSTDGAGNLSWATTPFLNYWQLSGTTLEPISNAYNLAVRGPANTPVFEVNSATGITRVINPSATASPYLETIPGTSEMRIVSSQTTAFAERLSLEGEVVSLKAYGSSFFNTPAVVNLSETKMESTVSIATNGSVTVNANSINSFATPPTRGTTGQLLTSNGDGTTSWKTFLNNDYWTRVGTTLLPTTAGDIVQVVAADVTPSVILDPSAKMTAIRGLQSLTVDGNYAPGTTQIISKSGGAGAGGSAPGNLLITGNTVTIQPWGNAFTNDETSFIHSQSQGFVFNTKIAGVTTTLLNAKKDGDLVVGRYIDNMAPSLYVEGSNGNVTVGGRLTVNAGVPSPGSLAAYSFPDNRGVLDFVLTTNADGTTRWANVSSLTGFWSEAGDKSTIYPSLLGQNVTLRNTLGNASITLDADGFMTALGGDANNPTYGFVGNRTGFYGGLTDQINVGVNGTKVAKFDDNFFYCYQDIDFWGEATNPGCNAKIQNSNVDLIISASDDPNIEKDIIFENSENSQVGKFSKFGDFTVDYGNAAIGSNVITSSNTHVTLSVGDNSAGNAGKLKFYSVFNAGDGAEITQDPGTGDIEFSVNSASAPLLTLGTITSNLTSGLNVTGDLSCQGNFSVPSPTVPTNASAPGVTGEIAWDANYIYVCVAVNTWKRTPINTW